jgi:acyl dehydratase
MVGPRKFDPSELESTTPGSVLGFSDWLHVTQERVDQFAAATSDDQWIHTDTVRAAASSFGGTISHGYLILALLPALARTAYQVRGSEMTINYGLNRVRFITPVRVGSRVRTRHELHKLQRMVKAIHLVTDVTMWIEGNERTALVAQTISRIVLK